MAEKRPAPQYVIATWLWQQYEKEHGGTDIGDHYAEAGQLIDHLRANGYDVHQSGTAGAMRQVRADEGTER